MRYAIRQQGHEPNSQLVLVSKGCHALKKWPKHESNHLHLLLKRPFSEERDTISHGEFWAIWSK